MNNLMNNIQKILKNNEEIVGLFVAAIIVIGIVWAIQQYYPAEYMENVEETPLDTPLVQENDASPEVQEPQYVLPAPVLNGATNAAPVPDFGVQSSTVLPEELLPKSEIAAQFEDQFPVGSGDLTTKNFLTAGYNAGINTVSSSLRNANLQIRSDVPIPIKEVGPWSQSTILPDMNRKTLEIGS